MIANIKIRSVSDPSTKLRVVLSLSKDDACAWGWAAFAKATAPKGRECLD
jgi:hypothetical protein